MSAITGGVAVALLASLPMATIAGREPTNGRTPLERQNLARTEYFWTHVFTPLKVERFHEYVAAQFIEHNPTFEGNLEELVKFFSEERRKCPNGPPAEPILMSMVDGDLVALIVLRADDPDNHDAPKAGRRLGFEIFRLKGGQQVEHWDETMRSDDPMLRSPKP